MAGDGVEIGTAYVTILPDGSRVGPEVKKSFGVVDQEADRVGKTAGKRFGGVFSSTAGKLMAGAGGIFAVAKAKDYLGEAIGAASDLNEAGTKLQAIFGGATTQVQAFASKGAKALGQSKLDVLDAAATFGVFGKAAGLQGPKLAKFSTRLTGLATDLASFHNADPSEVVEALGAALRGEAEPMRRFGVLLNDASLKAEAMSLGLLKPVKDRTKIETAQARLTVAQMNYNKAVKDSGKDSIEAIRAQATLGSSQNTLRKAVEGTIPPLTGQQKTLAAQSLIFKQTRDAQGDFVKTSGGLANQQRILSARFEDLKGTIGKGFLPVALKTTKFLNEHAAPAVEGFINDFATGKGKGGQVRELFESIRDDAQKTAKFLGNVAKAFDDLPAPLKKGLAAGAAGLYLGKKTGLTSLLGSPNTKGGAGGGLLGLVTKAKPLPVFVVNQVPGGGAGGLPGAAAPAAARTATAAEGATATATGAAIAKATAKALSPFRFGLGGAFASAGGVRTYDLTKKNATGLRALPFTPDLMKFASQATEIENGVRAVKALDKSMASLAMRRPGQALAEFRTTARQTNQSTADLAKQLPATAEAFQKAGINAKTADAKVFGVAASAKKATRELQFLAQQQPRVTIRTNAEKVKRDLFSVKKAIEEATVTRTAHIRIAIEQQKKGVVGGFGIQRASGGPAYAGTAYRWQEGGPGEMFVPGEDGRILSRRDAMAALAGRGGPGVQINVDKLMPHDYNDFTRQMQSRAARAQMGGF